MGSILSSLTGSGGASAANRAAGFETAGSQRGIDEMRRQFNITQRNMQPFLAAGQGAIPGAVQASTQGGLEERLAQILGGDAFQELTGERERALQGQLSAGGLTRSGTALEEIANVPTDLAFQIEQLLSGRESALMGGGQNAASNIGQFGAQSSSNIANLLAQQGVSQGSGALGAAQSRAGGSENLVNIAATAAAIYFSDPRLKENVEQISEIRDLSVYQWDWIPETEGTIVAKCGTIGFMADEVQEKYPQHVAEYGGFMVIDYPALLDELAYDA